jgi:hypothetical protein
LPAAVRFVCESTTQAYKPAEIPGVSRDLRVIRLDKRGCSR